MKHNVNKILAMMMAALLAAGLFSPVQAVFAASNTTFNPTFTYDQEAGDWMIDWLPIDGTHQVTVSWHHPDSSAPDKTVTQTSTLDTLVDGKNRIRLEFEPDHIYDLNFSFTDTDGNPVSFRDRYNVQVTGDMIFFLSDMTFEGTSFNDASYEGDGLLDKSQDVSNPVTLLESGKDPKVTLRWKVPTIWEPAVGNFLDVTDKNVDLNRLKTNPASTVNIDDPYFHISMNVVRDIVTTQVFRTGYDNDTGKIIMRETGNEVSGFNDDGAVVTPDEFVFYTLDQSNGITPGTEYQRISIRLYMWNNAENRQITTSRLLTGFDNGQEFLVRNSDNIFQTIQGRIDSVFTPMRYDVTKIDVDKMEVRIYKIRSRNYAELFYQVQDAGSVYELLRDTGGAGNGIKLPDASIPGSAEWGSVIVEIPLSQDGGHPEHYYRVIVTDGNAQTPMGSLAIDLRMLGNDTGKPPVPREIKAETQYASKQEVTYFNNQAEGQTVKIPTTDLKISFEKPLQWRTRLWGDIQSEPDNDNDFIFHILLNTYLTDDVRNMETRVLEDQEGRKVTVFVPVKEKRVLAIGKKQLQEDPANSSRLVYEMDGTELFRDLSEDESLAFENNEDYDVNSRPDYPEFLLPNTRYYLRMFSTRRGDSELVNWANRTGLDNISYISPVVSFTTFPSKDPPVPLPNLVLKPTEPEPDPVTGKPAFKGISLSFSKVISDNDWKEYTNIIENRKIVYDLYISESTDESSFILLGADCMEPSGLLQTLYPDENPNSGISAVITRFPAGAGEPLKPNTTYYFRMQAKLYVNNETEPFLASDFTPIKSVTTPKIDLDDLDDLERKPRTPVEFSVSVKDGVPQLTDAKVTLYWQHAETDVTYEMVCTKERLAGDYDYSADAYNRAFLEAFRVSTGNELNIDINHLGSHAEYEAVSRAVRLTAERFLTPNTLYFFSLRAVRNRGEENASYSEWVSIPVTTRMVAPPDFIEAVYDVQLGFKMQLAGNVKQEDIRIQLKKGYQSNASWTEVNRSKYSVVKDESDFYVRLYDLEPDTWYDIRPYYLDGDEKIWYDGKDRIWADIERQPVKMKTRNTLNEIEVRFAGEDLYDYFLEIRTDADEDYIRLEYRNEAGNSDYGYWLPDGTRPDGVVDGFYREKITSYVVEGLEDKYVYYAKISAVQMKKGDGTLERRSLLSNTRYYVKAWARNITDSAHIGPALVRTDFSQDDYDKDHFEDVVTDLFESRADGLTRKLYFTVDEPDKTANRVLLKAAMISGLLKVSGPSGVTVDISAEKPGVSQDIVLIPMDVLTALQKTNNRLTIRLAESELTLTGETVDIDALKKAADAYGVKEAMLELVIERKQAGRAEPPQGQMIGSKVFDITMRAVGMKRTYAEMNEIIYDILKEPEATGPFKYGILERELIKLLGEKETLTYKVQAELDGLISQLVEKLEEELSLYIRDILDGGRGFAASRISRRELQELDGAMKLKMLHNGSQSLVRPMVLPTGAAAWQEPPGVKAWLFPYVLVNCKASGQYAVFTTPAVTIAVTDATGAVNPELQRLSLKYDLQKVFGKTLYPEDFVSKDNAVALFEVVAETGNETLGMSVPAKIKHYRLENVLPAAGLNAKVNRQQAASLVVEIYAHKTGVSADVLRPTTHRYIRNASAIPDPVYHRLVIALDLGLTKLEADNSYKGESFVTVEEILKEIMMVLDLLGEW